MKIEDILSKEEIKEYHQEWKDFKGKYVPETSYNVHSGMPVLGKPFQFKDKYLFRSHVFQKKLRKIDPYFIARDYVFPFWHGMHYHLVFEQMAHASLHLFKPDYSKFMGKEVPEATLWRMPIFWDENISIGLTFEGVLPIGLGAQKGRITALFYQDNKNRIISTMSYLVCWGFRKFAQDIENLRLGKENALENLIRRIKHREADHKKLLNPRQNLLANADELIARLQAGEIPEAELHDFFSFWDKTKK